MNEKRLDQLIDFVNREGDEVHLELLLSLMEEHAVALRAAEMSSSHWGTYVSCALPGGMRNPVRHSVLRAGDTANVVGVGLYVCADAGGGNNATWVPATWQSLVPVQQKLAEAQAEIAMLHDQRVADSKEMAALVLAANEIYEALDFELRTHDGALADRFGDGAFTRVRGAYERFWRDARKAMGR